MKYLQLFILLIITFHCYGEPKYPEKINISVNRYFLPNNAEDPYTRVLIDFMNKNSDIQLTEWGGISISNSGKASLMMAIAGETAPDIGESWFHIIRNEIKQDFLYPLNEWIGEDVNGDGEIDDNEAIWDGWKEIPPLLRKVATVDGKVYGIPNPSSNIMGIIYRTDLVKAAGLDPNSPPKTWDEFMQWCYKLTDANKIIPGSITNQGQKALELPSNGYIFLPWVQSAGGEPIIQKKISPLTGKKYIFPMNAINFKTPDGEDLSQQPSIWQLNLDSPESMEVMAFYHKLRWGKWVNVDGKPMSLEQARQKGFNFSHQDINTGVCRGASGQTGESAWELLSRGEIAMLIADIDSLGQSNNNVDPSLLSWFPFPAANKSKGDQVVQTINHYIVMYDGVSKRPKTERDAVWKTMQVLHDKKITDEQTTMSVLSGLSRFIAPKTLERLGYEEYIRDIPKAIQENFQNIETGKVKSFTEPWIGFWFLIDSALSRECTSILLGAKGEFFDSQEALIEVNRKANSGLMFDTPEEILAKWRPLALGILIVVICAVAFLLYHIIKSFIVQKKNVGSRAVSQKMLPYFLILPALAIILLWRYYPLCRGFIMAFQDYKVTGESIFVGLDNFINLFRDGSFWGSMGRTIYFVFLNMLLAFTAPILLAIMLTEIRKFKILYRTLFFLPQMTSGLVIALMWKMMYTPTPAGFFNQIIAYLNYIPFVNIEPQVWLSDPALAMICCIIPTVWAGMGMASLLYLAALHSLPKELYEAAEVDGAGFRKKLWHITIPTLLPLIIINFVGTFIATFQGMGNIFLMTFGGPGEATMVIGLKIWIEAYANLRFSMATAMACVLGAVLIGFTYIQIQFLNRVEYKKSSE